VSLGFADGLILAFRPGRILIVPVGELDRAVAAIVADPDGRLVVALHHTEQAAVVTAFTQQADGSFRPRPASHFPASSGGWLTPILLHGTDALVGVGDGPGPIFIVDALSGLPRACVSLEGEGPAVMAILLPAVAGFRLLIQEGPRWVLRDAEGARIGRPRTMWQPDGGGRHPRCSVPLSVAWHGGTVRVIGLDVFGAVHATGVYAEEGVFEVVMSCVATTAGGYLAAAPVPAGPDRVVAVSESRIDWLSPGSDRFQVVRTVEVPALAATVACFRSTVPNEVLVVTLDGFVARVEAPRRAAIARGHA
jgi:hypothetical protein